MTWKITEVKNEKKKFGRIRQTVRRAGSHKEHRE
jgi:hypothetical protein